MRTPKQARKECNQWLSVWVDTKGLYQDTLQTVSNTRRNLVYSLIKADQAEEAEKVMPIPGHWFRGNLHHYHMTATHILYVRQRKYGYTGILVNRYTGQMIDQSEYSSLDAIDNDPTIKSYFTWL